MSDTPKTCACSCCGPTCRCGDANRPANECCCGPECKCGPDCQCPASCNCPANRAAKS